MGLAVGIWTTVARRPARVAISTTNLGQLALIICRCRCPYARGRLIDLTAAAARILGFSGLARVTVERVGNQS